MVVVVVAWWDVRLVVEFFIHFSFPGSKSEKYCFGLGLSCCACMHFVTYQVHLDNNPVAERGRYGWTEACVDTRDLPLSPF